MHSSAVNGLRMGLQLLDFLDSELQLERKIAQVRKPCNCYQDIRADHLHLDIRDGAEQCASRKLGTGTQILKVTQSYRARMDPKLLFGHYYFFTNFLRCSVSAASFGCQTAGKSLV